MNESRKCAVAEQGCVERFNELKPVRVPQWRCSLNPRRTYSGHNMFSLFLESHPNRT
jgi:hypothetical protein